MQSNQSPLTVAARAYSVSEAHVMQSMLWSHGVENWLFDLTTLNGDPGLMVACGGVRVMVATDEAELAQLLLWEGRVETPLNHPYSGNPAINAFIAFLLFLMGIPSPTRLHANRN
jgi:hypothetical protein